MTETDLLLVIHQARSPLLDWFFVVSHYLGTLEVGIVLCLAMATAHHLAGRRREALAWILVGLAVLAISQVVKPIVARPRPGLWLGPVVIGGWSFPSGHALAAAAFYPLLAWSSSPHRPWARRLTWTVTLVPPLYIGWGRLYLGLHWPTDVLAGWLLGAILSGAALSWLRQGASAQRDSRSRLGG